MSTSGLREIPTEDLEAELQARRDNDERLAYQRRLLKRKMVIQHRDVLLQLMDHSRNSCTSYNNAHYHPEHGGADCDRCCLEVLDEHDDVDVNVRIVLTQHKTNRKQRGES